MSGLLPASLGGNTTNKRKLSHLFGTPHIGRNNHKLNLDVDGMAFSSKPLKQILVNKLAA